MHTAASGILGGAAAGDAEIVVERVSAKAADPIRNIAQQKACVEHLVVEREIADGNKV